MCVKWELVEITGKVTKSNEFPSHEQGHFAVRSQQRLTALVEIIFEREHVDSVVHLHHFWMPNWTRIFCQQVKQNMVEIIPFGIIGPTGAARIHPTDVEATKKGHSVEGKRNKLISILHICDYVNEANFGTTSIRV